LDKIGDIIIVRGEYAEDDNAGDKSVIDDNADVMRSNLVAMLLILVVRNIMVVR
jgi:hypothetical protein